MTEKQIIDRLDSINLSLRQKKDLIDIIKDIADNSAGGGGGTSTDKDALYIYFDWDTYNIIINDKIFTTEHDTSSGFFNITIRNKELYNTLYNSLVGTNTIIYIKTLSTNKVQIFGNLNYYADGENDIIFTGFIEMTLFCLSVRNK